MAISVWQRGIAMVGDASNFNVKIDHFGWLSKAKASGISAVTIKIAHGTDPVNEWFFEQGWDKRLRDAGMKVGTWSFPVGDDPEAEAVNDVRLVRKHLPFTQRWHITNAEYKYKIAPEKCLAYATAFRRDAPLMQAALCPESNTFWHPMLGPITGYFYKAFADRGFRSFVQTYDGDMRAYEAADVWWANVRQDYGSGFGPNRVKVCLGMAGDFRATSGQLLDQCMRLKTKGFTVGGMMYFLGETMLETDWAVVRWCLDNKLILR